MRGHVYLDWNATTPPHPDVVAAMRAALGDGWANPASVHGPGRVARDHVERAREAVARLLGVDARDVTLTSGGTEANNLALRGAPAPRGPRGFVTSRLEHPSVTRVVEALAEVGEIVEWAPIEPSGVVDVGGVGAAIDRAHARGARDIVVAQQAVNHETGVLQPVADVVALAQARGARVHVDAVQAVGRIPCAPWAGADLVAVASHKIRGPKGVGALAVRPGLRLRGLLAGGAQERGLRPGTQDPVACAGLAAAAARAVATPARYADVARLRDALEASLAELGARHGAPPVVNGSSPRAPHVTNLSWPGWRGEELCAALDLEGVAVSAGAACSAGTAEPSPVLTAMVGVERAACAVRVSLGEDTTEADVELALERWARVLGRTR